MSQVILLVFQWLITWRTMVSELEHDWSNDPGFKTCTYLADMSRGPSRQLACLCCIWRIRIRVSRQRRTKASCFSLVQSTSIELL